MPIDAISKSENFFNEASKKVQIASTTGNTGGTDVKLVQKTSAVSLQDESNQKYKQDSSTEQKIKDAISVANKKLAEKRTRCEFSYYKEVNRISIKIFDRETNEVIKEIPAEESLETLEKIWDLAGLLVDERC